VRQDERGPLLDGQSKEGTLDLVSIDELPEAIFARRLVDLGDGDLDRPPSAPPDLVLAGSNEQPVEPGVESIAIPKAAKVAPGPDERVLNGILRGIPIAQDPPRDRVQAVVCGTREGIECLAVAPLCALDELGRHRRSSVRHGNFPRYRVWRRGIGESFSGAARRG
jgi:hypothetical protein